MNKSIVLLVWLILLPAMAVAATIHVPVDQSTIQAGINTALDGDTVMVAPGTYLENISIQDKGITLVSSDGRANTTLKPALPSTPLIAYTHCRTKDNAFRGFTLADVSNASTLYAESCFILIADNRFTRGYHPGDWDDGTATLLYGNYVVKDNVFDSNQVGDQGGGVMLISLDSSLVEGNIFAYNFSKHGGGIAVTGSNAIIRRNLFHSNNTMGYGGAIFLYYTNDCHVYNNTIDSCLSQNSTGGGIGVYESRDDAIVNNIISHCTGYSIWLGPSNGIYADYNDCFAGVPTNYHGIAAGTGSISEDPQFVGGVPFDYHLAHMSPCIDAGNPDPAYNDPNGTRNDMGAFESSVEGVPYPTAINYGPSASGSTVYTLTPTIYWSFFDTAATTQTGFEIEVGVDTNWAVAEMWSSGSVMLPDTSVVYGGLPLSDAQVYHSRIRLSNGIVWGSWKATSFFTHLTKCIHVPSQQPTIQAGINAALDSDTVMVAPGTYLENLLIQNKGIILISSDGKANTTLKPALPSIPLVAYTQCNTKVNAFQGFTLADVSDASTLYAESCFVMIANNRFTRGLHLWGLDDGTATLLYGDYIVKDNVFDSNQVGDQGGGLMLISRDSSLVEGNVFFANFSRHGAGIAVTGSNAVIRRNLFHSNTSLGYGGAIFLYWTSNCQVYNNTIDSCESQNSTGGGIGLYESSSDAMLNNVISHCTGYSIWLGPSSGSYATYNNCFSGVPTNYSGISAGTGSISEDPQFVGGVPFDYHLAHISPCIDAGNPDPAYNDPNGTRNDMGAFPLSAEGVPYSTSINYGPSASGSTVFTLTPTIYWSFFDTAATLQAGFEIEVGTDANWAVAEMWSSGSVMLPDTNVVYGGLPLSDQHQYYLRIRLYNGIAWGIWMMSSFRPHVSTCIYVPSQQPTIQAGINAALDGDTVMVAPETYFENLSIQRKGITLVSSDGRANTILKPVLPSIPLVAYTQCNTKENVFRGFTLADVSNTSTLYAESCFVLIADNRFTGGQHMGFEDDGTATLLYGNYVVKDNVFDSNQVGDQGGGLMLISRFFSMVEGNVFFNNFSKHGAGIAVTGSNAVIRRNLFLSNTSMGYGGAIFLYHTNDCQVYNNTIDSCKSQNSTGGGIGLYESRDDAIVNNIISHCTGYSIWLGPSNGIYADYNDCYAGFPANYSGIAAGAGSISADPQFLGGVPFDYHLAHMSPCINAGNPTAVYNDPDGSRNDMGRFSFSNRPPSPFDLLTPVNGTSVGISTLRPLFSWNPSADPDSGDIVIYDLVIATDSNFSFVQQVPNLGVTNHTLTADLQWGKQYWWNVRARDGNGGESWSTQIFTFRTATLGDANNDGIVNVSDIVFLISYMFVGGGAPQPLMTGNPNCDGSMNIADVVYLINYVFAHGPAPCAAF